MDQIPGRVAVAFPESRELAIERAAAGKRGAFPSREEWSDPECAGVAVRVGQLASTARNRPKEHQNRHENIFDSSFIGDALAGNDSH